MEKHLLSASVARETIPNAVWLSCRPVTIYPACQFSYASKFHHVKVQAGCDTLLKIASNNALLELGHEMRGPGEWGGGRGKRGYSVGLTRGVCWRSGM